MKTSLNGKWKLNSKKLTNLDINIPGTVLDCLLENKIIEDPYYRDNEEKTKPWLFDDYSLTKEFSLTKEQLLKHNYLCFYSIICVADIYINDTLIIKMKDMHIGKKIKLDNHILKEKNIIRVDIKSPYEYIKNNPNRDNFITVDVTEPHSANLRQANYMFGWDWGINIADMGIMGDIYILSTELGYLKSHREKYEWKENGDVDVLIKTTTNRVGNGTITISFSYKGKEIYNNSQELNISNEFKINVKNPHLWWPNGYGDQPLYDVKITIQNNNEIIEEKYRLGLKRVRIDDSLDQFGRNFAIYINDQKIFIGGANYIPEDALLSRITEDRTRRLLQLCKDANFTGVRVWGGGFYPFDYFYDICDELGLLVMQDLMFACASYDIFEEEFKNNVIEETKFNLRRIRHHASLLFISGNNENEDGIRGSGFKHAVSYVEMYHHVLKNLVEELTDFYYLPSSPTSGEPLFAMPNDPDYLDCHYWWVWAWECPIEQYLTIKPRFLSEFGMQSFPTIDTVKTYAIEEDMSLDSKVMLVHQKRSGCNPRLLKYTRDYFKEPENFTELIYLTQITQAYAMRVMVEHIRQNLDRCNGALYWQLNDDWPGQTWSAIDYNFGLKALYYYSKRFYNQDLVSFYKKEDGVAINVSNTSKSKKKYVLKYHFESFKGQTKESGETSLTVKPYECVDIVTKLRDTQDDEVLYAELFDEKGNMVSNNYFQSKLSKDVKYENANITLEKIDDKSFKVKSDVFAREIYLEAHDFDLVLDDNYFFLLAGQEKIIHVNKKIDINKIEIKHLK